MASLLNGNIPERQGRWDHDRGQAVSLPLDGLFKLLGSRFTYNSLVISSEEKAASCLLMDFSSGKDAACPLFSLGEAFRRNWMRYLHRPTPSLPLASLLKRIIPERQGRWDHLTDFAFNTDRPPKARRFAHLCMISDRKVKKSSFNKWFVKKIVRIISNTSVRN